MQSRGKYTLSLCQPEVFTDPLCRLGRISTIQGGDRVTSGLYVCGWLKRGPSGIIGRDFLDSDYSCPEAGCQYFWHVTCSETII